MKLSNVKFLIRHFFEGFKVENQDDQVKQVFLHIPKTAGNSFIRCIYENYAQSSIYPNYFEKSILNRGSYITVENLLENKEDLLKSKQWLIGHFDYNIVQAIWPQAKVYVLLRDPVYRIISNIEHLRLKDARYKDVSFEFLLDKYGKSMAWQQARLLGYDPKSNNLEQVFKRIEQLHFVGITSHFDRCLDILKAEGWKKLRHTKMNKGLYSKSDILESQIESVKSLDLIDQKVYDFACDVFKRRVAKL